MSHPVISLESPSTSSSNIHEQTNESSPWRTAQRRATEPTGSSSLFLRRSQTGLLGESQGADIRNTPTTSPSNKTIQKSRSTSLAEESSHSPIKIRSPSLLKGSGSSITNFFRRRKSLLLDDLATINQETEEDSDVKVRVVTAASSLEEIQNLRFEDINTEFVVSFRDSKGALVDGTIKVTSDALLVYKNKNGFLTGHNTPKKPHFTFYVKRISTHTIIDHESKYTIHYDWPDDADQDRTHKKGTFHHGCEVISFFTATEPRKLKQAVDLVMRKQQDRRDVFSRNVSWHERDP